MKKNLFQLIICLLLTVTSYAQSLQIIDQGTNIINGSYLYVIGDATSFDINKNVWVFNNSGQSLTLRVTRKEMDVVAGTLNATCWDICPPSDTAGDAPILTSSTSVTMASGDYEYSFSAHIYPEGIAGCSHFRYIFYAENASVTDSFDIYFNHGQACTQVAAVENISNAVSFEVFPNPAADKVNIMLSDYITDGELVVTNLLGEVVRRKNINNLSGNTELSVADFENGLYFVSIISENKTISTRRFQVLK